MKYFDYAATAPMRPEALAVYSEVATRYFGNTQSLHDHGTEAMRVVEQCRAFWGNAFQGDPSGVFFTGSASEANQLAIRSLVKGKAGTILANHLEHASILIVLGELQKEGYHVKWLPLTKTGEVDTEKLHELLDDSVILLICQWVNSETGIIQPLEVITEAARTRHIPVHCDAVQGFGKLTLNDWTKHTASLTVSAHKFGGPKGTGIVWMNPAFHWQPVYEGATHQSGFRAGTLDVPAIAAATRAAEIALEKQPALLERAKTYHDNIQSRLPAHVDIVGYRAKKSPFIIGLIGFGVDGQHTLLEANRSQFAFSTGSACKIGHGEAMSALTSLGYPEDVARQFVRISFGYGTKLVDVEELGEWLRGR